MPCALLKHQNRISCDYMVQFINNRFRPAEQGKQNCFVIVLGLIVHILIGLAHDLFLKFFACHKEELPMKTKAIRALVAVSKSILNSVWTVDTNLLASALLA